MKEQFQSLFFLQLSAQSFNLRLVFFREVIPIDFNFSEQFFKTGIDHGLHDQAILFHGLEHLGEVTSLHEDAIGLDLHFCDIRFFGTEALSDQVDELLMFKRQLGDELQLKELFFKVNNLDLDDRRVRVSQGQDKTLLRHFVNDAQTTFGSTSNNLLNELFSFKDFRDNLFTGHHFFNGVFADFLIHGSSP